MIGILVEDHGLTLHKVTNDSDFLLSQLFILGFFLLLFLFLLWFALSIDILVIIFSFRATTVFVVAPLLFNRGLVIFLLLSFGLSHLNLGLDCDVLEVLFDIT